MPIAYLNGHYLPREQAQISVMDRGFLFGDGVYEVIPVYDGKMFKLNEHLKRLQHSLDSVLLDCGQSMAEIETMLAKLIELNGGGNIHVYLQVTRGASPERRHDLPQEYQATVLAFTLAMPTINYDKAKAGLSAVTLEDMRWQRCDIKAITLLPNVLLNHQAVSAGVDTAILIKDGHAIEGTASNLFVVVGDTIITPPLGKDILSGITRQALIDLARDNGINVIEKSILKDSLYRADEIWMTSSTKEIIPIVELDGQTIGIGCGGPLWEKVYRLFVDHK